LSKVFVSNIKDREQVNTVFLVKEKIMAMAKNGKPYMTLHLMDKSGEIEGRIWDNVDVIAGQFEKDDFVAIRSKASVYLGKMQLIINDLAKVADADVRLADFLPEAERDMEGMLVELGSLVASCSDENLAKLLSAFFNDPSFMALYRIAPAAKGMHHVYLGGLLEHSLAVARLTEHIALQYPGVNRDLLVTGALLHDVGKVREMSYIRSFDYTDEGKLLGHITIGVEMIQEKIAGIAGFPSELAMLLKHMIISHHGQYEFGSPKRPKTVEATVLNYLDDLDSKINGIRTHIKKEPANHNRWTAYHRLYDRYFYKDTYLPEEERLDSCADCIKESQEQEELPCIKEAEKKGFHNSPFDKLQDKNLDLF
jgi:3'-5' exoribonuclease